MASPHIASKARIRRLLVPGTLLFLSSVLAMACAQPERQPEAELSLPDDYSDLETEARGMLMYMADAPILRECTTGALFPVRMEGAWLDTERAYLTLQDSHPGWVLAEGSARFSWGAPMEGPERWLAGFTELPALSAGATCGQDLDRLQDREWQVVYLDGLPRSRFDEGHQPTVKLTADGEADGSLAASGHTGCNRFGGSASLNDDQLSFGDIAATRMYCMNTADIERRFLEILGEVARGSQEGDRWVWYDASGRWLAEFQS